ncbi:class I SAM-dependent methyltransferase [Sporomusa sphaeroides]|jgi:SAM-dependent methyltransferase|uniref:class I SAM-dependent methyltransferase n=1 Tax=Sporomusa sphaeroides TaxID=47679 RepID=UPI002C282FA8|nr:class I SAM-dependent methyltransferase [Sporomusa sphaeroides]HML31819.1 class I SAM-dependent methyltransferase [Sporomusa sphaeroides]
MCNTKFWTDAWQEARDTYQVPRYGSKQDWQHFWNTFAELHALRNRQSRPIYNAVIEGLAADGVITPFSTVLDIGCGAGTYTLPLAAKTRQVTGLDTAEQMLAMLQSEAAHEGLTCRIAPLNTDWLELPAEPAYDVVFAANTTAINDYDSLMKMNELSRGVCCLVGFAGAYHSKVRTLLWEHLMGTPPEHAAFDIQYPFNILYQERYLPNIKFYSYRERYRETLTYMIEYYTSYFRLFGLEGPETTAKITGFLANRAVEDYCTELINTTIGVLWWRADRKSIILE